MYKLVAIDCDNTLIKNNGEIHEENIKALKMILDKGVKVVIATGRNDILVKDFMDEVGFKEEIVIGCNGGSIRDLKDESIIEANYISKNAIRKIIEVCNEYNIKARFYTLSESYCINDGDNTDELAEYFKRYTKVLSRFIDCKHTKDLSSLVEEKDFLKVVVNDEDEKELSIIRKRFEEIEDIAPVISAKNCLDIVKKGVSKGQALKNYSESLGIKPEEIVAIGDSENDLEMLKFAGYSVAMGNAEEFIKDACDMVTLTNDEGGVANAIYKLFK